MNCTANLAAFMEMPGEEEDEEGKDCDNEEEAAGGRVSSAICAEMSFLYLTSSSDM